MINLCSRENFDFLIRKAEKGRQIESQQFDFMTKYAEMEFRLKQLQTSLDQAHQETFEHKSKLDDVMNARSSEIEIINQDLERANEVRTKKKQKENFLFRTENFSSFVQRASNAERLADRLREQIDKLQENLSSIPDSTELHSNEENQRRIREKLEFDLAAKEREIAALVADTQKLQSTLIKVRETSLSQVSLSGKFLIGT